MEGNILWIILSRLCFTSDIIDVKVILNLDIQDIDLVTCGLLGKSSLFSGLVLGCLDQLLLCLHLHLNQFTLSPRSIRLLRGLLLITVNFRLFVLLLLFFLFFFLIFLLSLPI